MKIGKVEIKAKPFNGAVIIIPAIVVDYDNESEFYVGIGWLFFGVVITIQKRGGQK